MVLQLIPFIGTLLYLINGLIVVFSKEKRGIHDILAKTQVIKVKQPWSLTKQLVMILLPLIIAGFVFTYIYIFYASALYK